MGKRFVKSVRDFFKVIFRNRQTTVGLFILVFFILMATVGTAVTPLDMTVDFANRFRMPSAQHWLGTDYLGRDILAQTIHGSRDVLTLGAVCALMALALGIAVGAAGAFIGGWVDTALNFVTNIFLTIPSFPLMLILAVATSIDALAVGVTFAFLNVQILPAVSLIGVTTFVLSAVGVRVGNVFGSRYKSKAELAGGIILVLMGVKILLEHLGILG